MAPSATTNGTGSTMLPSGPIRVPTIEVFEFQTTR
jgi:hypothetical protein